MARPQRNLFRDAPVTETGTERKASAVVEIKELSDLDDYTALDLAEKTIQALKEKVRLKIEKVAGDHFLDAAIEKKERPANFKGQGNNSSASIELRKRTSSSVLNTAQITILTQHKIPVETVRVVEPTYIFNPAYFQDAALFKKINAALAKIPDLPEDLILKQESKENCVVSDQTLAALFSSNLDRERLSVLLAICTKLVIAQPETSITEFEALGHAEKSLASTLLKSPDLSFVQPASPKIKV